MRIRRRPGFVPSSPLPIHSPDLSKGRVKELKDEHPWTAHQGGEMQVAAKSAGQLHPVEDQKLEPRRASPCFKSQVLTQELNESHYPHHPSDNGRYRIPGAPSAPATKRPGSSIVVKAKAAIFHSDICERTNSSESNGCKRWSGASLLTEGSRCSRVNGRGWRCNQQTFVGYSLCEHHLGKSRLRSIGLVKTQSYRPGSSEKLADVGKEMETKKTKRKSIGVVKARSITSLFEDDKSIVPFSASSAPPPMLP